MKKAYVDMERLAGAMRRRVKEFASWRDVHYSTISRRLTGDFKLTIEDLNEFAEFLNRDVTDFLVFKEEAS